MHYFHNNGNGTFTDQAAKAGLTGQLGVALNLMQTDYNNDGCTDILVLRGAWHPQNVAHRKSLLRNNCNGTFTDVTKESGLAKPATNTQAAVWADINNDGFLDLLWGTRAGPASSSSIKATEPSKTSPKPQASTAPHFEGRSGRRLR